MPSFESMQMERCRRPKTDFTFSTSFFGLLFAIKPLSACFKQNSFLVKIILVSFALLVSLDLCAQQQLSQSKAERLFQKGSELIAHSNFGAARKVFADFLLEATESDPRRPEAEYYVALSALRLSHQDGEKLIEDFIAHNPSTPKAATAYYDLANFFHDEKNYSKALIYYKKVDFPALTQGQQQEAHFKWGYSLFNLKKLDEALEQFNFVKNLNSEFAPAANYYAGYIEYSAGQYEAALADLRKAERNSSYASVVPHLIANVYYKQKNYDELLSYIASLKSRTDLQNKDELAMLSAEASYFKGDYKTAAEAYERFLGDQAAKAEPSLLFRAGYSNYALNQVGKAVNYLGKAASSKDSVSFYASYYLGIMYLKQGEKQLAINAFDFARKYEKDDKLQEESSFQLAKVTYDAGRQEQAITEFESFLRRFRASDHVNEVKELLAQAYVNGNNYHKAIEYIESLPSRSQSVDIAYQKATYLKGAELFNKEDYAGAVFNFERSLTVPKDIKYVALASFWAAEAYSVARKYPEAIRHYNKVLETGTAAEPEVQLKTRYGLGYAAYNSKDYERAQFNFRDFVNRGNRTTPNYADALIRLGDCHYIAKRYPEALEHYEKARAIGSPDNDYVLLQSGIINGIQKKYVESRALLTSLIQSYAKSTYRDEALYQRAQFDIEQGNSQAAIDGLSQLISESGSSKYLPYALMRRAGSYFNLKKFDLTIADYKTILVQYANHPVAQEVLLPLQEALTASGKGGDFEGYLAEFKKNNPDNKGIESIEFETGKNLYFDQQYKKAIASLNAFVTTYPQSVRIQESKYYIGESHYRLKEFQNALPLYEELETDPTFSFATRVTSRLAELQFKLNQHERAVRSFRKLERIAANKKEQSAAWMGLMESYFLLSKYDSSDAYARTILEKGAVTIAAQNKAALYLGKSAFARGDYETAKDEFLQTLNTAQDEHGAEAKYRLAEIFYLEKQYTPMYETLISLTNDFASYDNWVGKAYLLLSEYFIVTGDLFNARATLESLVEHFPLEDVKENARRKLADLDTIERQRAAADTTNSNR